MTTSTPTSTAADVETASTVSAEAKHPYDLKERTLAFAIQVRSFVRKTPRTIASLGDCRQLIKSSGELGAACVEADIFRGKGFLPRLYDCRREAMQCAYWIQLLGENLEDERLEEARLDLYQESEELTKIFGAIIGKIQKDRKEKAEETQKE